MPNVDKPKANSQKKRLGRGLGSLLSTNVGDFDSDSKEIAKSEQVPSQPKAQAKEPSQKPSQPSQKTSQVTTQPIQNPKPEPTVPAHARIWTLSIDKLNPNKEQPRKDFEKAALQELADSIKEQGILQPITARKKGDEFEIIAGERRWRAAQLAGLFEVPVILKDVDDRQVMELALIENIQRKDLNPLEEAQAYQQLMDDYSLTQQEVAKKVGKERATVANSVRILTLPFEVRSALKEGKISLGHAKVLLSEADSERQISLCKLVQKKKLSVRALEKELKKSPKEMGHLEGLDVNERLTQALADDLQKLLGTKVHIMYKNGKGRIEIYYYSDDELNDISEKIKDTWQQNP